MRQTYFCPHCRALITVGDRFCSNCGTHLNWVVLQTPPLPSRESCGYPDGQVTRQQQLPPGDKQPVCRQQHNTSKELSTIPQKNRSSAGGTATPITTEISRLLADFLSKQVKNN